MIDSLYIAESGMTSQQKMIDIISNNIANSSTSGFKKSQVNFVDLVYQTQPTANTAQVAEMVGAGVRLGENQTDFSVGEMKATGNPFDVAIQGAGFFEVTLSDGDSAYTRAGRLRVDDDGYLTTSAGLRLSSNIQLPPDAAEFVISRDGIVTARLGDDLAFTQLGELELVKFTNEQSLSTIGDNLYAASANSGNAIYARPGEQGTGTIVQGFSEISNVSMTEEMVNLMLAQRGYQLNARIIQISDQLLDTINNLRR